MKLERRKSFGWPATSPAGYANPTRGLVVHYDGSNQGLAGRPHSACREYWKRTRNFHTGPSRGWADLGYSYGCCPHGIILEGRGLNRAQAAQPGGNTTWYSVTFMGGPSEHPTSAQLRAFRELRAYLMNRDVAGVVSYHGRFISTSCPGPILIGLVNSGAIIRGDAGGTTPPPTGGRVISAGDAGADVLAVQAQLVYLGYDLGTHGADGRFGADTEKAVRAFQRAAGISVDGAVGPETRAALDAAVEKERADMPEHNRFYKTTKTAPQKLPRNEWRQIEFEGSSRKPGAEGGLYSVAFGDVKYSVTADVRLSGLNTGDEYQVRFVEYEQQDGAWVRARARGIREHFHGDGDAYNGGAQNGRLSGKRRLRLEVKQWTSDEAELVSVEVDPLVWKV